ncbi:hypothetical protein [Flavobacterium sp. GCM10023249]|uniref:hypothetical protein n=1 Tax=unclassified Flavobacterium TaxID=196869 RepID=UPI0036228204
MHGVRIEAAKIRNNFHYASVLFIEYRHSWQYTTPYRGFKTAFQYWENKYGRGWMGYGGVWAVIERDAYWYQIQMGEDNSFILSEYKKAVDASPNFKH